MVDEPDRSSSKCLGVLARIGLLLKQDKELPSVVGLITGEVLRGSWWSHPQSHRIYHELELLADHPDVLVTKLVGGKDTFIHRRLWPAFVSVATGGEPWQRHGLSSDATKLLTEVERAGRGASTGELARELRERLLVHATEVHTSSGRHELILEPWTSWLNQHPVERARSAAAGREELEGVLEPLGGKQSSLPWRRFSPESGRKRPGKRA